MSKFNAKSLAIAETADMPIRDVSGEPMFDDEGRPVTVTLYSPGTRKAMAAAHARMQKNQDRTFAKMQGKSDGKQSADDVNAERAEFLANITVQFNNLDYVDAEGNSPAGRELAKAIYSDITIGHIADDVEKFHNDRANFKKPSASN